MSKQTIFTGDKYILIEMIQRLQTVYLFLTTLLSFLFLRGSYINFIDKSGAEIKFVFSGIFRSSNGELLEIIQKTLPVSIFIILIPLLSMTTIFLYKNRKVQLLLSLVIMVFISAFIVLSGYYSYYVMNEYSYIILPGYKMTLPVLMLVFTYMAYRGIRKDDLLIKSYDRLR